jgi:D-3-phosphoglycerate dehydrogenase
VQLVGEGGFTDIAITYSSPRGDDLDTRLLRAMVIKGILEETTTSTVNLVGRGGARWRVAPGVRLRKTAGFAGLSGTARIGRGRPCPLLRFKP